jgi:hypothetical protein
VNYAPFGPSPSIGGRGFAVSDAECVDAAAIKFLIQRHKWPIRAPEKQRNNSEKTAA